MLNDYVTPKKTRWGFQSGTMVKILNAFGFFVRLSIMFEVLINLHVLYLITQAPRVVLWPKYLLDGHGSRLIDVLFALAFFEIVSCILIVAVGHYQRLWGLRRKTTVRWYFVFTVLMTILNYWACSEIASAC